MTRADVFLVCVLSWAMISSGCNCGEVARPDPSVDGGIDAGAPDAGASDGGAPDAGGADSGVTDGGHDAGSLALPSPGDHMIEHGVAAFVIVQPSGCMPNHVSGRGAMKAIRERHPRVQLVAIDYDPDVSVANIENRLQLLVMRAKEAKAG